MAGSGKIRVLIVDDILESRDNVAKLLRFEPDVEIVGMAEGGQEGIDLALQLEPDIVLMDINMPGVDGITATQRINARLPNTAVIMMSVQNEPDYLRRAMLAGAREFLAKPFSLDELVESIRHVHQLAQSTRRVIPDPAHTPVPIGGGKGRSAQLLSVFSLKGGVGRSTLAINLAVALRNQAPDREVCIVDGNLLYGDVGVMMNITQNKTIADIIRNFQTLDRDLISDILVTHSSGVKVLLAPPDPQAGEQVTAEHMRQILHHLHAMMDFIIIDTRPSFDDVTLTLLDLSDRILLTMCLELTAIKGAKQYLELGDLLGYDQDKILLVLNRASVQAGIPITDIETSLKGELIAKLPDDPMLVLRAINEGVPFMQSAPHSALSQEIAALAAYLTRPEEVEAEPEASAPPPPQPVRGLSRWIRPAVRKKAG
ncbi:MAG TPA: response regulator [Thermomicrobiales bacterium]